MVRLKTIFSSNNITMLYKSIMAGLLISMGCISYLLIENHVIGSFIFSLGLYTIILLQLDLYTGKVGYLCTQENKLKYIGYLIEVWFGNIIGCFLVGLAVSWSRITVPLNSITAIKLSDNYVSLAVLGVLCGMLMCIAVEGYRRCKNPLIVVMPVMAFILCGYEHSIADAAYFFIYREISFEAIMVVLIVTIGNAIGGNLIGIGNKFYI